MTNPHYSLSWEKHQSNILSTLSSMQQNGDLVDMTIAADGHMVKVHQLMMALVSPYMKDLISSTNGQHPVIFLNNVSYTTLCNLLEYIYTGEATVPVENINSFMMAAKSLHIKGLESLTTPDGSTGKTSILRSVKPNYEQNTESSQRKHGLTSASSNVASKRSKVDEPVMDFESLDQDEDTGPAAADDSDSEFLFNPQASSVVKDRPIATSATSIQFTISNRGSLQLIVNRFMYNLQSTSERVGLRRWRCVHYRGHKCPAYVVTKGNAVVNRGNPHNHAFHDKKILAKIEQNAVYSAIDDVKGVKDSGQRDDTENDNDTSADPTWEALD